MLDPNQNSSLDFRLFRLEKKLDLILEKLGIQHYDDLNAHIAAPLAAHKKIEAIKLYRERTGVGLKEAKDAVEEIEKGRAIDEDQF